VRSRRVVSTTKRSDLHAHGCSSPRKLLHTFHALKIISRETLTIVSQTRLRHFCSFLSPTFKSTLSSLLTPEPCQRSPASLGSLHESKASLLCRACSRRRLLGFPLYIHATCVGLQAVRDVQRGLLPATCLYTGQRTVHPRIPSFPPHPFHLCRHARPPSRRGAAIKILVPSLRALCPRRSQASSPSSFFPSSLLPVLLRNMAAIAEVPPSLPGAKVAREGGGEDGGGDEVSTGEKGDVRVSPSGRVCEGS